MPRKEQSARKSGARTQEAGGATFEGQLATLEKIVRELERGDLPLERSLELFEQGVRLSRECQNRLTEAERRIEVLLQDEAGRSFIAGAFEGEGLQRGAGERDDDDDDGEAVDDDETVF